MTINKGIKDYSLLAFLYEYYSHVRACYYVTILCLSFYEFLISNLYHLGNDDE